MTSGPPHDSADRHLSVHVVTPDGELWAGQARTVSLPTFDGQLGILPRHQPLLGLLGHGHLRIHPLVGETVTLTVAGGFLSVDNDTVTVLADAAGATSGPGGLHRP